MFIAVLLIQIRVVFVGTVQFVAERKKHKWNRGIGVTFILTV